MVGGVSLPCISGGLCQRLWEGLVRLAFQVGYAHDCGRG